MLVVALGEVRPVVRAARLLARQRGGHDHARDGELVAQVQRLLPGRVGLPAAGHRQLRGLLGELVDPVACALEPAAVAHHATALPHRSFSARGDGERQPLPVALQRGERQRLRAPHLLAGRRRAAGARGPAAPPCRRRARRRRSTRRRRCRRAGWRRGRRRRPRRRRSSPSMRVRQSRSMTTPPMWKWAVGETSTRPVREVEADLRACAPTMPAKRRSTSSRRGARRRSARRRWACPRPAMISM